MSCLSPAQLAALPKASLKWFCQGWSQVTLFNSPKGAGMASASRKGGLKGPDWKCHLLLPDQIPFRLLLLYPYSAVSDLAAESGYNHL